MSLIDFFALSRIERKIDRILLHLHLIEQTELTEMAKLDDIQAEADQIRDGVTALIDKVNAEAATIADLQTQLAAAGNDPAKVDAISAELAEAVTRLQTATAVATPPEPGTVTA